MFQLNQQLAQQRVHAHALHGVRRRSLQVALQGRRTEDRRLTR